MNRAAIIVAVLFAAGYPAYLTATKPDRTTTQAPVRVALIGFTRSGTTTNTLPLELALGEALGRDPRVALIDPSIVQSALLGIGYDGSINMSKDEARKLGAAIGCDFFIVGKAEALTRSERENESHEEAYSGVMIVDGRTGALTAFDFISDKASTRESALQALIKTLDARVASYVDRMIQVRAQARTPQSRDSASAGSTSGDLVEDVPGEGSPRSAGFKPPEFINRVKPEYATEAEIADITATVEAMVVFRSNGEVGGIEITRWAGFGLDESSERAIRQLKFKPATRDGNAINVRAMIRYNFRRITEPAGKLEQPASKPPDTPERDLRQLFKPTYRRP
jgi:Gram-negative bacterial TonB protein C-terminal